MHIPLHFLPPPQHRDFAYVARDLISRRHMCHVFRCDSPARQIANTLRDICKKIMMERSLQQTTASVQKIGVSRPTDLPNLERFGSANGQKLTFESLVKSEFWVFILFKDRYLHYLYLFLMLKEWTWFHILFLDTSFPTPMEEPKKVLRCHYLGTAQVPRPTGKGDLHLARYCTAAAHKQICRKYTPLHILCGFVVP